MVKCLDLCAWSVCKECPKAEKEGYLAQKHTSDISNYKLISKFDAKKTPQQNLKYNVVEGIRNFWAIISHWLPP